MIYVLILDMDTTELVLSSVRSFICDAWFSSAIQHFSDWSLSLFSPIFVMQVIPRIWAFWINILVLVLPFQLCLSIWFRRQVVTNVPGWPQTCSSSPDSASQRSLAFTTTPGVWQYYRTVPCFKEFQFLIDQSDSSGTLAWQLSQYGREMYHFIKY